MHAGCLAEIDLRSASLARMIGIALSCLQADNSTC